ncbi:hypothetical protein [Aliivibrio logei]|uniref:DUF4956 domain-containing protein n=1 Tax=Aliivibrio logei 5S-186 TaxID=626086 RepID=A0ABX3ASD3_ALILO|nr:hypothetical protein [Aliivibrio logei]OEF10696.1 hypothetical protein A1Q5_12695 [Aliivibrio logei 5S-186]
MQKLLGSFDVSSLPDWLTLLSFVIGLVMFVPWLFERKSFIQKVLTLDFLINVLLLSGVVVGQLYGGAFGTVLTTSSWVLAVYAVFRIDSSELEKVRTGIVTFVIRTCAFFAISTGTIIGAVVDIQSVVVDRQNLDFQVLLKVADNQQQLMSIFEDSGFELSDDISEKRVEHIKANLKSVNEIIESQGK